MPNINDLKKSNFLKKNDCEPPILVTIKSYEEMNVAKEGVEPELKWALHFEELEKPLVLNSTKGQIIAGITKAEDFDGWIGHKIVLYHDPNIAFGGRLVGGIAVRAPRNQPAKPAPAPAAKAPARSPAQAPDDTGEVEEQTPF